MEVTDEEYHRRIRWQVLVEARLGVWANLPAGMIPLFERALMEFETRPIRFEQLPMFEYRVWPVQTETNLVTGTVKRMQRVLLLTIKAGRRVFLSCEVRSVDHRPALQGCWKDASRTDLWQNKFRGKI